jgi:hypothetical protein
LCATVCRARHHRTHVLNRQWQPAGIMISYARRKPKYVTFGKEAAGGSDGANENYLCRVAKPDVGLPAIH